MCPEDLWQRIVSVVCVSSISETAVFSPDAESEFIDTADEKSAKHARSTFRLTPIPRSVSPTRSSAHIEAQFRGQEADCLECVRVAPTASDQRHVVDLV